MNNNMVGVFVQARVDSKRLPTKMLLPLGDGTIFTQSLKAAKQIPADIYAVLTTEKDASFLSNDAAQNGFDIITGPEEDVLERFCIAVQSYEVERVIRITGDKAIISIGHMKELLKISEIGYDLTCCDEEPVRSTTGGIFKASALLQVNVIYNRGLKIREHVKPCFIDGHEHAWNVERLHISQELKNINIDFSIDTREDYFLIKKMFKDIKNTPIKLEDAIKWYLNGN